MPRVVSGVSLEVEELDLKSAHSCAHPSCSLSGIWSAFQHPHFHSCTIKGQGSKGTLHVQTPGRIVGLPQQVDVQAPSRSADAGKRVPALWWECKNVSKNAFMDCFVWKCLLSDTPQGFTGQVANVRSVAWEFPSTKAALPLFVTPQRTSWSTTRDPYLTHSLSPWLWHLHSAAKSWCQPSKRKKEFWISIECAHLQVCAYINMPVCVCLCMLMEKK